MRWIQTSRCYVDAVLKVRISIRMRSYLDPRETWDVEVFRPVWDAELLRPTWDAELLKPAFEVTCRVAQTLILKSTFTLEREVRVLVETLPSRWSEARIVRTCLLMIFRQPTELPPKFLTLRDWLGWISEYFRLHVNFRLPMIGLAIFRDALSLILSGFWSSWVYCWTAWSLQVRLSWVFLETQSITCMSSGLFLSVFY